MGYLVGTDEAGYGPNLGPLVITATVWHVPGNPHQVDLYQRLAHCISAKLPGRAEKAAERTVLADSKVVYQSGRGLPLLERGVLSMLGLLGRRPTNWHELWNALSPTCGDALHNQPWHVDYECNVPLAVGLDELGENCRCLQRAFKQAKVKLVDVRSRAVFPDEFNAVTEGLDNKSTALTELTLGLLADVLAPLEGAPVSVICDKHGGRNFYQGMLQQYLTDQLVEVCKEGREESAYRWGPPRRRTQVFFRMGGERWLPAALASMTCKYLREVSMGAFNQYWARHVPDLKPTAGYYGDAHRFRREIADAQTALGIDDRLVWRNR